MEEESDNSKKTYNVPMINETLHDFPPGMIPLDNRTVMKVFMQAYLDYKHCYRLPNKNKLNTTIQVTVEKLKNHYERMEKPVASDSHLKRALSNLATQFLENKRRLIKFEEDGSLRLNKKQQLFYDKLAQIFPAGNYLTSDSLELTANQLSSKKQAPRPKKRPRSPSPDSCPEKSFFVIRLKNPPEHLTE